MAESPDPKRTAVLERRVRWLDRYRHAIAIAIAVIALPILVSELHEVLGPEWPRFHALLLALVGVAACWWLLEVTLAWLAAMWETEHDRLARDLALPSARLVRRR
jgi:hypothetical protein